MRWRVDRAGQSWILPKQVNGNKGRKPFVVGEEDDVDSFDFTKPRPGMEMGPNSFNADVSAKTLFTAKKWIWTINKEDEALRPSRPTLKY